MDAVTTPSPARPRPHRVIVNLDAETLERIDALAVMARESRSRVIAEVLQTFAPMFQPIAAALEVARTRPQEAIRQIQQQAESVRVAAEGAVRKARALQPPVE